MKIENEHPPRILIIGMTAAGADSLPATLIERILAADLLVGGKRHLGYFPEFMAETVPITSSVETVAQRLREAQSDGMRCVVLASGDPLCYGIGTSLRRYFDTNELEIVPAPTAFQMAFAALGEPWHDALLLSAHARPLADVVTAVQWKIENRKLKIENGPQPIAAILTDNDHTPSVVAQALIDAGMSGTARCAICENLGGSDERIVKTNLADAAQSEFAVLNVFVVWDEPVTVPSPNRGGLGRGRNDANQTTTPFVEANEDRVCGGNEAELSTSHPHLSSPSLGEEPPRDDQSSRYTAAITESVTVPSPSRGGLGRGRTWGHPDTEFTTSAAQITKREIRLLTLAELQLEPNGVLWDIGAGSGSVGIEAALGQSSAQVYAIEKRPEFVDHMRENVARFGVKNLRVVNGNAPDVCAEWPDPSAVFVGGSGGRLAEIIEMMKARLRDGGRLVINLATLENLQVARDRLPDARVNQVQISRGVPIVEMLRFEALNPIFMVVWQKERDASCVVRGA